MTSNNNIVDAQNITKLMTNNYQKDEVNSQIDKIITDKDNVLSKKHTISKRYVPHKFLARSRPYNKHNRFKHHKKNSMNRLVHNQKNKLLNKIKK